MWVSQWTLNDGLFYYTIFVAIPGYWISYWTVLKLPGSHAIFGLILIQAILGQTHPPPPAPPPFFMMIQRIWPKHVLTIMHCMIYEVKIIGQMPISNVVSCSSDFNLLLGFSSKPRPNNFWAVRAQHLISSFDWSSPGVCTSNPRHVFGARKVHT